MAPVSGTCVVGITREEDSGRDVADNNNKKKKIKRKKINLK